MTDVDTLKIIIKEAHNETMQLLYISLLEQQIFRHEMHICAMQKKCDYFASALESQKKHQLSDEVRTQYHEIKNELLLISTSINQLTDRYDGGKKEQQASMIILENHERRLAILEEKNKKTDFDL